MSKKVSVIVPAYNMSAYLQQTLESVCASDYDNYEVIVMDDGSKDNTLQTAQAFAATHKQVRVFTQPNGGVCKARNNAIRHSEGEYILPLDADDLITPDFIRLAAEVLDSDMNIKGVGCEAEFFGDRSGHWHLPKFSPGLLARKSIINASAMYRRADFDKTSGYNETFTAREDWDFWLQMFANGGEFLPLLSHTQRLQARTRQQTQARTDKTHQCPAPRFSLSLSSWSATLPPHLVKTDKLLPLGERQRERVATDRKQVS